MLMCSEETIPCSCSSVGRLTIVMVSPREGVGAGRIGVAVDADGEAKRAYWVGAAAALAVGRAAVAALRGAGVRGGADVDVAMGAAADADAEMDAPAGRLAACVRAPRVAPMPSIS